jgi:hypothetical protein
MSFQIHALPAAEFAPLFELSDAELSARGAKRVVADASPGFPCRVSLADAELGETLILTGYEHQPHDTPYRSRYAIYVREGVAEAQPEPGVVPESLARRLMSARAFDADHMLIAADVVEGPELAPAIERLFADPRAAYLHLHNAKPGCYAARVTRA